MTNKKPSTKSANTNKKPVKAEAKAEVGQKVSTVNPDANKQIADAIKEMEMERQILEAGPPVPLNVTDLRVVVTVFDAANQANIFNMNDMAVVGGVYNKLVNVINFEEAKNRKAKREAQN